MITIFATLKVKEGKMDEATAAIKDVVAKIKASEPGCLAYIPHTVRGAGNENIIMMYERYTDKDALKVHSANFPKSLEKLLPLLEPGMDIKTCNEIL
jgi:quinol monooxygenase YgiN